MKCLLQLKEGVALKVVFSVSPLVVKLHLTLLSSKPILAALLSQIVERLERKAAEKRAEREPNRHTLTLEPPSDGAPKAAPEKRRADRET